MEFFWKARFQKRYRSNDWLTLALFGSVLTGRWNFLCSGDPVALIVTVSFRTILEFAQGCVPGDPSRGPTRVIQ